MDFIASVSKRLVRIAGEPNSGWSAADPDDLNAAELEFNFFVTSDGGSNYLLVYRSVDARYSADTWHETIEDAMACANEAFGIEFDEWSKWQDARTP
jgi:hypothetical protein